MVAILLMLRFLCFFDWKNIEMCFRSLSNTGSKVTDDGSTTNSSSGETDSEDTSEDEPTPTRPFQFS